MERWSGELESGWRRRDAEINTGQERVDQEEEEESRIPKSHSELLLSLLLMFIIMNYFT